MSMRIKEMRERRGLSQAQMADHMGVCRATACRWESGEITPNALRIPRLAKLLNCTTDELYGSDSPEPQQSSA